MRDILDRSSQRDSVAIIVRRAKIINISPQYLCKLRLLWHMDGFVLFWCDVASPDRVSQYGTAGTANDDLQGLYTWGCDDCGVMASRLNYL